MTMPVSTFRRREQRGGAVALVVMGHRLRRGPSSSAATPGCGPSACTEDFSSMHNTIALSGGFRYRPDHVDEFLLEPRVVGQLERLRPDAASNPARPHPLHRALGHPDRLGHRPAAPMRLALRPVILGQLHDLSILSCGIDGLRPRPLRTCPNLPDHPRRTASASSPPWPATPTIACAIAVFAAPSAPSTKPSPAPPHDGPRLRPRQRLQHLTLPLGISNAATGFLMQGSYSNQTLSICATHH